MSSETMTPAPSAAEPTSNERLLAALSYPLFPLVSLFILLVEEHKNKAFERYHAIQSLGAGVVVWVLFFILSTVLSAVTFGIGAICVPLLWIVAFVPLLYWAYQGYQGQCFEIPVITKFMRDQKWL
jgi:uncharacterized membrane protein